MLIRLRDYLLIAIGALIQALAMDLFLVPGRLAAGGVSGAAQIVNRYTGWPIGILIIAANLPLFFLGWRLLGGRRFLGRTVFAVVSYSVLLDLLAPVVPTGLTPDPVLNSLYGGLLGGLGMGLVFRGQGTSGGTDILARLLGRWRGIPLSQSYLITDAVVVFVAGLAFSWELALYALVALYVSGLAAEVAAEGAGAVRTATVITRRPQAVADQIMRDLQRGVTSWPGQGMYSGEARQILFCAASSPAPKSARSRRWCTRPIPRLLSSLGRRTRRSARASNRSNPDSAFQFSAACFRFGLCYSVCYVPKRK